MHKLRDANNIIFLCNEQCTYQNSLVDVKYKNDYEYKNCEERRVTLSEIELKSLMLKEAIIPIGQELKQ